MRRAFVCARLFAVSGQIAPHPSGLIEKAVRDLLSAGVETVFFEDARQFEHSGAVVLGFREEDKISAGTADFFAAPASAPLGVKMACAYVSPLDGEDAAVEMANLIIAAKRS